MLFGVGFPGARRHRPEPVPDSVWRNRHEFTTGRAEIISFLRRKWDRELDYALRKEMRAFGDNRIAVRYQYESHDGKGQ